MNPTIEKKNDIDIIRINYERKSYWNQWILLMSDEHYDSKHCDRKMLKRHHEQAKDRNAIVLKFGDVFDCMGGKYDPRSGKGDIRPEYQIEGYFDAIVEDAAKFYEPYKDNIYFISAGNHENSILKRQEVDILKRLGLMLGVEKRPYNGHIKFQFESTSKGSRSSKLLYYTHGNGGSSPVTRGVINTNRRQTFINADYIISGHTHSMYYIPLPTVSINEQGFMRKSEQIHVSLGTYKDDSFTGNWADEKEFAPPNMGGYWIKFYYEDGIIKSRFIRAE